MAGVLPGGSRPLLYVSQTVIGCMIARALTPEILAIFAQRWPILLRAQRALEDETLAQVREDEGGLD